MAHQFPTLKEKMKIQVNEANCFMPKQNEPHSLKHSNGIELEHNTAPGKVNLLQWN